ncbi:hypothetical protein MKZ38_008299 [Zalerion maritima]|uniref:DUF7689 domain-containing protein n=1 Tax=Zalerion maritima TaxID=339359 RepID=A0AAD5RGU2_9PEZI|nr:hypothetical protein MKZ38_008299 [Zalerion maritima]
MANQELTNFQRDIIRDHSAANERAQNFVVYPDTESSYFNCFAYVVNETSRKVTPASFALLVDEFAGYGYFKISPTENFEAHDVEVYIKHNIALHAHRIKDPLSGDCESKMGEGPIISHPRAMLDSPGRNRPNFYKFGRISHRFRYNEEQFRAWKLKNICQTTSGRDIWNRDAMATSSGKIIHKNLAQKSRSGRIVKKTPKAKGKAKEGKAKGKHGSSSGPKKHGNHKPHISNATDDYGDDYDNYGDNYAPYKSFRTRKVSALRGWTLFPVAENQSSF